MGFVGKLLSSVSSAVLILLGASSGGSASVSPPGPEQKQQLPSIGGGAGELLAGFVLDTGGRYTEEAVEAAVLRMIDGMSPDRITDMPEFVRGLRSLELAPEVKVAAVETLISALEEWSGSLVSAEKSAAVTAQIFDEFVQPLQVAMGEDPTGKFSESLLFPGNPHGFSQGEKKGRPFQPS